MKFGTDGSKRARWPPVSGSQNLPSGRFTREDGRLDESVYSVQLPVAGSKCAILKPPSSVIQKVPSVSRRSELGAVDDGMTQRERVMRSADQREIVLSEAATPQMLPAESLTRFAPSKFPIARPVEGTPVNVQISEPAVKGRGVGVGVGVGVVEGVGVGVGVGVDVGLGVGVGVGSCARAGRASATEPIAKRRSLQ